MIALFDVNAGAVRKTVEIERKDAKKAAKPAGKAKTAEKKAEKQSSVTAAAPLPPCEAAQAAENSGEERRFKVGDRVRVREDISGGMAGWIAQVRGRIGEIAAVVDDEMPYSVVFDGHRADDRFAEEELDPAPTEAAQAGDGNGEDIIETNETPTGTEPAEAEEKAGEGVTEGAEIEPYEKPKGTQRTPAAFAHPSDASLTWTGRGRRPAWVAAWIEEGGTLEDLRAKEAA